MPSNTHKYNAQSRGVAHTGSEKPLLSIDTRFSPRCTSTIRAPAATAPCPVVSHFALPDAAAAAAAAAEDGVAPDTPPTLEVEPDACKGLAMPWPGTTKMLWRGVWWDGSRGGLGGTAVAVVGDLASVGAEMEGARCTRGTAIESAAPALPLAAEPLVLLAPALVEEAEEEAEDSDGSVMVTGDWGETAGPIRLLILSDTSSGFGCSESDGRRSTDGVEGRRRVSEWDDGVAGDSVEEEEEEEEEAEAVEEGEALNEPRLTGVRVLDVALGAGGGGAAADRRLGRDGLGEEAAPECGAAASDSKCTLPRPALGSVGDASG